MPHLTEMAKKYAGKATFTGVNVWETKNPTDDSYIPKVEEFVKNKGDIMGYNVAIDGHEGTMAHTWMEAAGRNGIPAAFIVDQTGTIVWIGHPMVWLYEAVGQVIAGTFDVKAEAAKQAKAREFEEKQMAAMNSYIKPFRAGDFKGAVAGMDKLIASDPAMEMNLGITRYVALSNYDPSAANDYARKLENGVYKDQAMMLNSLAWAMVDDKGQAKGVDSKLAVEIGEKCVGVTKDGDPMAAYNIDTLASCYFKDGQIDKAIATQERALKVADSTKNFDATTRKEIAGRLELFKQKKGSGK
ncbi:MAG: hypothetical protein ACHQ50_11420 [Fimbriimonadales bacterium]